jgi:hypothetical protein
MKKLLLALSLFLSLSSCADKEETVKSFPTVPPMVMDAGLPDTGTDASVDYSKYFDRGIEFNAPLKYYGGPVMKSSVTAYMIWYGNWSSKNTPALLENFIDNIDKSEWYSNHFEYYQYPQSLLKSPGIDRVKIKEYIKPAVALGDSIYFDPYLGNKLTHDDISGLVKQSIHNGLPLDRNAVYFVMTDEDTKLTDGFVLGFCSIYCGWHNSFVLNGVTVKYSFIGDTEQCPYDCSNKEVYQKLGFEHSPNEDWSADGMASTIAHELSEMVTDPEPRVNPAWADDYGYENADKCAWTYGPLYKTENNSLANVKVGEKDWLIQQNWFLDENGGRCDIKR